MMKQNKGKKAGMILMTLALLMVLVLPAAAAGKRSIQITGKKNVKVGKVIELDTKIRPERPEIKDHRIIWSSSDPSVAKVLEKRDDDTKIRGIRAGKAVISVRVRGTSLKADYEITVKNKKAGKKQKTSVDTLLKGYEKEAEQLRGEILNLKKAATVSERRNQYYRMDDRIEMLEDKTDRLEDRLKKEYHSGKISRTEYRSKKAAVERAEDKMESLEDLLDQKFGYEFDD